MPKIAAIVQARMGSSRLPGKVAREIMGKAMLTHIIERLKKSSKIGQIIIATSSKKQDDKIADIAKENGVKVYRGSEDDVLSRYLEAAQLNNIDLIVRITGDCPLIDPGTIDEILIDFLDSDLDYMRHADYPRGLDTEVFYYNTLLEAEKYIKKEEENKNNPYREHVTYYIYNHPEKFKFAKHQAPARLQRDYRLCVDEQKDFELIKKIYEKLYKENEIIDINKVIDFLDNNPEIAAINREVKQKKVSQER